MALNAAQFLALGAPRREVVQVEGAEVLVRELTVGERAQVLATARTEPARLPALLCRLCCVGDDGAPLFSSADEESLASLRPALVDAVAAAAMRMSGMVGEGDEKKGD